MWIGPYASQMFLRCFWRHACLLEFQRSHILLLINKFIIKFLFILFFILKSSLPLGNHLNRVFEQMFTTVHPLQLISTEHMCVNEKLEEKMTQRTDGWAMMFSGSSVIFHVGMTHTDECKSKPLLGSISFYSNFLFVCISVMTWSSRSELAHFRV